MTIHVPMPTARRSVSTDRMQRDDWTTSFQRPDPFFGKPHDPQSFHKYAYVHGDPVNNIDPTGLFSLAGSITVSGISGTLRGLSQSAIVGAAIRGLYKLAWYYGLYKALIKLQEAQQPLVPLNRQKVRDDYQYALLAQAAYESAVPDVPGWQHRRDYLYPETGFNARLYERNGERVLAFAGTGEPFFADWEANIEQGVFGDTEQYRQAIEEVVPAAESQFGPIDRFVGHSLGGGIASAAATVYLTPATTFNAAGVNPAFVAHFDADLSVANDLIDAYRVQGEALSSLQNVPIEWAAFPHPVVAFLGVVGAIAPDGVGTTFWLPGESFRPETRHLMPEVLEGMRKMM
ncbi:MAG: hypothetical protein KDA52_11290 [Planctomycetaceae bacterium]|nr:hypothetical protein [Planctomycetaceae bacterium]